MDETTQAISLLEKASASQAATLHSLTSKALGLASNRETIEKKGGVESSVLSILIEQSTLIINNLNSIPRGGEQIPVFGKVAIYSNSLRTLTELRKMIWSDSYHNGNLNQVTKNQSCFESINQGVRLVATYIKRKDSSYHGMSPSLNLWDHSSSKMSGLETEWRHFYKEKISDVEIIESKQSFDKDRDFVSDAIALVKLADVFAAIIQRISSDKTDHKAVAELKCITKNLLKQENVRPVRENVRPGKSDLPARDEIGSVIDGVARDLSQSSKTCSNIQIAKKLLLSCIQVGSSTLKSNCRQINENPVVMFTSVAMKWKAKLEQWLYSCTVQILQKWIYGDQQESRKDADKRKSPPNKHGECPSPAQKICKTQPNSNTSNQNSSTKALNSEQINETIFPGDENSSSPILHAQRIFSCNSPGISDSESDVEG